MTLEGFFEGFLSLSLPEEVGLQRSLLFLAAGRVIMIRICTIFLAFMVIVYCDMFFKQLVGKYDWTTCMHGRQFTSHLVQPFVVVVHYLKRTSFTPAVNSASVFLSRDSSGGAARPWYQRKNNAPGQTLGFETTKNNEMMERWRLGRWFNN